MHGIYLAHLDKNRPVVMLTREAVLPYVDRATVAPIYTRGHGLSSEVMVDEGNGLSHESFISCDNIATIPLADIGRQIGLLSNHQEEALVEALTYAFDLDFQG